MYNVASSGVVVCHISVNHPILRVSFLLSVPLYPVVTRVSVSCSFVIFSFEFFHVRCVAPESVIYICFSELMRCFLRLIFVTSSFWRWYIFLGYRWFYDTRTPLPLPFRCHDWYTVIVSCIFLLERLYIDTAWNLTVAKGFTRLNLLYYTSLVTSCPYFSRAIITDLLVPYLCVDPPPFLLPLIFHLTLVHFYSLSHLSDNLSVTCLLGYYRGHIRNRLQACQYIFKWYSVYDSGRFETTVRAVIYAFRTIPAFNFCGQPPPPPPLSNHLSVFRYWGGVVPNENLGLGSFEKILPKSSVRGFILFFY